MAALLPQFVVDLETDMQEIVSNTYSSLTAKQWWKQLVKTRTTGAKKDILWWVIDTFRLRSEGVEGGNKHFEELVSMQTEIEHAHFGGGIVIKNDQLLDQDGRGFDQAAHFARQAAQQMAYHPQGLAAHFLKNAHNLGTSGGYTAYDALAFFSNAHLLNPAKASAGTFANLLTSTAASTPSTDPLDALYPGACPIDAGVADDATRLKNLAKAWAYISSIYQPNAAQPRNLEVDKIFCGPAVYPFAVNLTSAKFLAAVAGSGGGTSDVQAFIQALGYGQPVLVPELAGFESDTTYFISTKTALDDPYGSVVYTEREPFSINFYGTMTERELKQRNELEYHVDGRNSMTAGRPEGLFKIKAT
jgi:hypothetical protein